MSINYPFNKKIFCRITIIINIFFNSLICLSIKYFNLLFYRYIFAQIKRLQKLVAPPGINLISYHFYQDILSSITFYEPYKYP